MRLLFYVMIKNFLITDSTGIALYSKSVNSAKEISTQLFSGLISTVGTVGKMLFKQKLATITFGSDVKNQNQVVILSKDRYGERKSIYFVFAGNHLENTIPLKEIAATLYIEAKKELTNPQNGDLKQKIDNLLENRFHNLTEI